MAAGKNGWPASSLAPEPPVQEDEQAALIDALQDWKTLHYQELIGASTFEILTDARPAAAVAGYAIDLRTLPATALTKREGPLPAVAN